MNYSTSEENYLKSIFHLQHGQDAVTTNELAGKLNTRPASVTDMMKKLKSKKLLHYQPYQGFRLSNEGRKVALDIIRRHRLWEFFLAEKLQFGWDEVHAIAEDLEHVSSKKLIDKLDAYLGNPRFDPHGDPIPDSSGKMDDPSQVSLSDLPAGTVAEVRRVINQSSDMLELLQHRKISIGVRLQVKRRFEFDKTLEIGIDRTGTFTISDQLAKNIFVTYEK